MLYLSVVVCLLVLAYFYDYRREERGRMVWFFIMLLAFILIAGLRYRLGTDSIRYERYFMYGPTLAELKQSDFFSTRFSPLYILFSASIRSVTDQFVVFQLVHAVIVNSVIFYFIYKNTRNIFFGLLIYGFFLYTSLNMEAIREAFAVCAFLLAWPFFRDGKWLWWYVMSFIGFMCHTSAVFMFILPIIAVPGIKQIFTVGKRTVPICILLCAIAFVIRIKFFSYVAQLAMLENVAERAAVYSKSDLASSSLNISGIILYYFRLVLYPVVALFILCDKENARFKSDSRFVEMVLMSVYIGIMSIAIPIFYRFNNYFFFFVIIALCDVVFTKFYLNFKRFKFRYLTWLIIFIPFFYLQVWVIYLGNVNRTGTLKTYMNYYPYASRIEMEKDPNREKVFSFNHAH